MANTNKITKKDYFEALKTFVDGGKLAYPADEVKAFIDNELVLLAKKANRSSDKPTANQQANIGIKETMLNILAQAAKPVTISEIMAYPELAGNSNQKLSALMKQLVDSGKVTRIADKKKAFFSVVAVAPVKVEDNPTA